MPYKIKKQDKKFCVFNTDTDENKGCSDTRAMAIKHMRAMYAAEGGAKMGKKEIEDMLVKSINDSDEPEDLLKCYGEMAHEYVPWGITSFADLDAWKEAQEASDAIRYDADTFTQLVGNIMGTSEVEDKVSAIKALADEFGERVRSNSDDIEGKEIADASRPKKQTLFSGIANKVKNLFNHNEKNAVPELMVYKDGEVYRWIARYSNNFRDNDKPPEIISAQSHSAFVEKVDKGLAPLPEFWIWHVPEWKIGQAEWVAWDEDGFALAGGVFSKGLDGFAEYISTIDDILMSHGMPRKTVKYDPQDKSVITAHETREISILPGWSAANQLTGFVVLKETNQEEASMAIPKDKREKLMKEWNLSEEQLSTIEQLNASDANKAKDEGLESKETAGAVPAAEPVAEPVVTETPAPTQNVDELRAMLTTVVETSVKPLVDRINELEGEMKALKESDGQKMSDLIKNSTTASLSSLLGQSIQSVIGLRETAVDGRTELAKDRPKESKPNIEGRTLVPFINEILASPKSQ